MAIWWFFAGELAIFGGAVVCYLLYRIHGGQAWAREAEHLLIPAGLLNTIVLLSSSLTAILAQSAAARREFLNASKYLTFTILLGVVFLGIKAFEYSKDLMEGLTPVKHLFWSFYYLATGLHAVHLVVGMIALGIIAAAARQGRYPGRIQIGAMYWHFVDVIWALIFPVFYLLSRGDF